MAVPISGPTSAMIRHDGSPAGPQECRRRWTPADCCKLPGTKALGMRSDGEAEPRTNPLSVAHDTTYAASQIRMTPYQGNMQAGPMGVAREFAC